MQASIPSLPTPPSLTPAQKDHTGRLSLDMSAYRRGEPEQGTRRSVALSPKPINNASLPSLKRRLDSVIQKKDVVDISSDSSSGEEEEELVRPKLKVQDAEKKDDRKRRHRRQDSVSEEETVQVVKRPKNVKNMVKKRTQSANQKESEDETQGVPPKKRVKVDILSSKSLPNGVMKSKVILSRNNSSEDEDSHPPKKKAKVSVESQKRPASISKGEAKTKQATLVFPVLQVQRSFPAPNVMAISDEPGSSKKLKHAPPAIKRQFSRTEALGKVERLKSDFTEDFTRKPNVREVDKGRPYVEVLVGKIEINPMKQVTPKAPPPPKVKRAIAPRKVSPPHFKPVIIPHLPDSSTMHDDLSLLHLQEFASTFNFNVHFNLFLGFSDDCDLHVSPDSNFDEEALENALTELARMLSREIIDDGVEVEGAWDALFQWMKKNGWKSMRGRKTRAGVGQGKFWVLVENAVKEGVSEEEKDEKDRGEEGKGRKKKFSSADDDEEEENEEESLPEREDIKQFTLGERVKLTGGLVDIWLSLSGCRGRKELVESQERIAVAKRDYTTAKKIIISEYEERKKELADSKPQMTLNDKGELSSNNAELKKDLEEWEVNENTVKKRWMRKMGDINVALYLATIKNRQRFVTLGSDLNGNEYWLLAPNESAIKKYSKEKEDNSSSEKDPILDVGFGLLVHGRGGQEKGKEARWWILETHEEVKKAMKWLEYQVKLSNFQSKGRLNEDEREEKEKEVKGQVGAKLRTDDEDLNGLVAGIKLFSEFLEGLEMKCSPDFKLLEDGKRKAQKRRC